MAVDVVGCKAIAGNVNVETAISNLRVLEQCTQIKFRCRDFTCVMTAVADAKVHRGVGNAKGGSERASGLEVVVGDHQRASVSNVTHPKSEAQPSDLQSL